MGESIKPQMDSYPDVYLTSHGLKLFFFLNDFHSPIPVPCILPLGVLIYLEPFQNAREWFKWNKTTLGPIAN